MSESETKQIIDYQFIENKFTANIIKTLRKLSMLYTVPNKVSSVGTSITRTKRMGMSMEIEKDVDPTPKFVDDLIEQVSSAFIELIINNLLERHSQVSKKDIGGSLSIMSLPEFYKHFEGKELEHVHVFREMRIMRDASYPHQYVIASPLVDRYFHSSPNNVEWALYHLPKAEYNKETNTIDFIVTFL